jgi:2-polyprenyl-3-methyl-5-hydroxy-6-metoxy-1,4-benzoquinol methylase
MPRPSKDDIDAGQAPYSKWFLSVYDFMILGLFCRYIWKCPSQNILDNYNQNISANHLDVGVGTGYHLDHCRFPAEKPRLALMDLNENCLKVTGKRLERYRPETYCGNVYEPFDTGTKRFDSVAINGLLHCLPGTMKDKGIIFDHAKQVLNPNGTVFGCTILNQGVEKGLAAKIMMRVTNNSQAFCNLEDGLNELKEEMSQRFEKVKVNVIGCMAIFSAQ